MNTRENKYAKRISNYKRLLDKQLRAINLTSNLRLLLFLGGTAGLVVTYVLRLNIVLTALIVAIAALFAYLVIKQTRLNKAKNLSSILLDINIKSLERIKDKWHTFQDSGQEFVDPVHNYSYDLDIFGSGSLFQMINCAITFKGRHKLRELLDCPKKTVADIRNRQKAIDELSGKLRWRQHFNGQALLIKDESSDPHPLFQWAAGSGQLTALIKLSRYVRWLPVISIPTLILLFTTPIMPWYIPTGLLILQFIFLGWNAGKLGMAFAMASKYKEAIRTNDRLIACFEKSAFSSDYLNILKNRLKDRNGQSACQQINKLIKIIDAIDNRANAFFFIINVLTLWDFQFLLVLETWKKTSGALLENWFDAIGEVEALSSLALLKHDNPSWATPEFREGALCYYANELGHPLLPSSARVANGLELRNNANILLITGSNMSGKSTYLRTAGINLVLAYAGAPVCAIAFQCSLMKIQTCMRVTDNLEQNTSSFYAELLRIKEIVSTSGTGEPLFFLLDEIFKGTNSMDRHTGAEAVINKLSKSKALGLVSTHDLELGELERTNPHITNYHFREFFKDDKIYFDYKLRSGVSTTRNAAYLMKMAGIDI